MQTTTAGAAAQVPSGESLLLAPAGHPETATSGSMPATPGDTYPPGSGYRQPPPPASNRPRRRLVLAWVIGGLIAAAAAGFAVIAFTGGNPSTPTPSPAGLTSSAAASTAGGRGGPWRICLPVCFPERVLLVERIIVPGLVHAGDHARVRAREHPCVQAGQHARIHPGEHAREHPGVHADEHPRVHADQHSGEHAYIHPGDHSYIHPGEHAHAGIRFCVAAVGEKGQYVALGARRHSPGSC